MALMSFRLSLIILVVAVFLIFLFISYHISQNHFFFTAQSRNNNHDSSLDPTAPRPIVLENQFDVSISVYFEDEEAGSFLVNMEPKASVEVIAVDGHSFFATHVDNWEKISKIFVRQNKNKYKFFPAQHIDSPHSSNSRGNLLSLSHNSSSAQGGVTLTISHHLRPPKKYQYNVTKKSARHHSISDLSRSQRVDIDSVPMAAKFRSLSARPIELYYDSGQRGAPGQLQCHLKSGQETTTTTYVGHKFYAVYPDSKNNRLMNFEITSDKVII